MRLHKVSADMSLQVTIMFLVHPSPTLEYISSLVILVPRKPPALEGHGNIESQAPACHLDVKHLHMAHTGMQGVPGYSTGGTLCQSAGPLRTLQQRLAVEVQGYEHHVHLLGYFLQVEILHLTSGVHNACHLGIHAHLLDLNQVPHAIIRPEQLCMPP